jgi:pimeloyl-ACP methyl ester carboxylesterase
VAPAPAGPVSLYAEETGEGPPLLLLHGLGESTFTWRKIVPALAQTHRVIALDLKGFGQSDKPLGTAYSADDQAALVAAFMEARGLKGVVLIGHSFGGTVALRTALVPAVREAGRIRRLVVIGAPALPRSVAPSLDVIEIPAVPDALASVVPPEAMARLLLREALGGAADMPEEDIKGYAAPYHDDAAKNAFLATARSIVSESGDEIASHYRTIREPTLIVWCRKDPIVPLRAGKRLKRTLPGARIAILENCHHLPQEETPLALIELIRSAAGN